jgi:hypothetical protein
LETWGAPASNVRNFVLGKRKRRRGSPRLHGATNVAAPWRRPALDVSAVVTIRRAQPVVPHLEFLHPSDTIGPVKTNRPFSTVFAAIAGAMLALVFVSRAEAVEIENIPPDLTTPEVMDGAPAPGRRVRQFHAEYDGSGVYHTVYLPVDWVKGVRYPVIVEFAGNEFRTSPGTVEGSSLGYGISGGRGVIWVCMPFVDAAKRVNARTWWGDVDATVAYCKKTVKSVCAEFGGDASNVIIAGFSRGAIACNFIGLHDDEIASLWAGFICHSHYEGVRAWPGSTPEGARERLGRLRDRPQFISHETSAAGTKAYLEKAMPGGKFTIVDLPFAAHTDTWVLRDIPERKLLRDWFRDVLRNTPSR